MRLSLILFLTLSSIFTILAHPAATRILPRGLSRHHAAQRLSKCRPSITTDVQSTDRGDSPSEGTNVGVSLWASENEDDENDGLSQASRDNEEEDGWKPVQKEHSTGDFEKHHKDCVGVECQMKHDDWDGWGDWGEWSGWREIGNEGQEISESSGNQIYTAPTPSPTEASFVDDQAGLDASTLRSGGYGQPTLAVQTISTSTQDKSQQRLTSMAGTHNYSSSAINGSTTSPVITSNAIEATKFSTNYVEVTEWYTPPIDTSSTAGIPSAWLPTSTHQASLLRSTSTRSSLTQSSQIDTPTTLTSNLPSSSTTRMADTDWDEGFTYSTVSGYSSSSIFTSLGQAIPTSSWHSKWTNTWEHTTPPTTSPAAPVVTDQPEDDDSKTFVDCHNKYRNQYGAKNVSWVNELANYAVNHASVCGSMSHTNGPYGENLAAGAISITSSIDMWMDEASQYDPENPSFSHFTQVVWQSTETIGCAKIDCGVNTGMSGQTYVMCEYQPAGNVVGSYAFNVKSKQY
ncbi:uncharacterized protein L201_007917 [Kwoniella dendrophila CBS 6074]|uniref:SCP domain-containing protein n=1 Tax=Kwoniella dendrophila CBS 6074 TaxID=1295534 RepID=A0AAX4K6D0_9TREE